MQIGSFNLGIRTDDTVQIHFDEKQLAYFFQGKLPNGFIWIRAMRQYTANQKKGENQRYQDAATFSNALHNRYGFEIHVHAYYINKIIPQMLKHDYGEPIKRAEEYQKTIKQLEGEVQKAQIAASDTQGSNIGKAYAANYEETKADYESLVKEWQAVTEKYQKEIQELNRLATNANAVIFTISIYSDLKIVPDNDVAAKLALTECINELNTRHNSLINDSIMQMFELRTVMQSYFFFLTEISGMFNPVIMASLAKDPYFFELYKSMFPNINAASTLQTNLENMRHLSSYSPSDILRKMLQQMELVTKTFIPPTVAPQAVQAQQQQQIPPREDYLNIGELIGRDTYGRDVRLDLKKLENHILIEGLTGKGKSSFARFLASKAMDLGMRVIVMDISYHWSMLLRRYGGSIFSRKLDAEEALKQPFTLCVGEKGNIEGIETNFLKPFYEYILRTRGHQARKEKDILLIVDEAHNFGKKLKRGVLVDIIAELGKYGIIVMLISQRSEYVGIDARSQAGLRFNTQISVDYIRAYADAYSKDIAETMLHIGKYNLFVHGVDIHHYFSMIPEKMPELSALSMEEIEKYKHKEPEVEVKPEPPKVEIPKEQPKQEPPKPKEEPPQPKVEIKPEIKKEELNEIEKKAIEALKANGGMFESSSKWFKAIGFNKTGESTQKIEKSLEEKGYVVFERINPTKKIIRLTEKGRTG